VEAVDAEPKAKEEAVAVDETETEVAEAVDAAEDLARLEDRASAAIGPAIASATATTQVNVTPVAAPT